jgi:thiol-disulfide isomerase/thioredoxin
MTKRSILLLFLLAFGYRIAAAQTRRPPNLEFQDLKGTRHKLADLRGSIAVVNYWATWCVPCREELPMLSKLMQKYAGAGVRFIAISADDDPTARKQRAKLDQFLEVQKPAMDIWLGADLDVLERCGLGQVLPATMVLNINGEVIARVEGQAREEDLTAPIEWLLHPGTNPKPSAALIKRY